MGQTLPPPKTPKPESPPNYSAARSRQLERQINATGARIDELSRELRLERERKAKCQACFDSGQVPIDGYLREEIRDPSERFKRTCRSCPSPVPKK